VSAVAVDANGVTVHSADGRAWKARHVIGADGAKGVVGARVGLRLEKRHGIAREIEIPFEGGAEDGRWHPALAPGAAYLDYGTVPNGYAWIFPKRNCLSVGSGMLLPRRPTADQNRGVGELLRRAIDLLLASVGLSLPEGAQAPRLWAHPIPFWTGAEPLATPDGRVLLAGDAAGVVQPLFGEGIQYAVRTGDLAARCLLAGEVGAYTGRVRALLADEFDAAARVSRIFHKAPFLSYRLGVKNPAGTRLVGRLMAGEASLAHLEARIYERLRNPLRR
jgi:flavin-dependent dehydrogenase